MKENIDFVVCQICGKQMKQITYKHLKFHNITTKQYKEQYPNSMIRCENSKNLHIEHQNSTNNKKYGYKSVFSDKNIIEKVMKKCMSKEPNKPEKIILDIIGDRGWYSGNGTFWLKFKNGNNKNPDFKIHGKNKVIEHYGEYWHRNDLAEDIVKLYNEIGYECLVIWEYELKDLSCIKYKINSFINN